MAHIKLQYLRWVCSAGFTEDECLKKRFHGCHDYDNEMGNPCPCLENIPGYLEKVSKNVSFDGECLRINNRHIAELQADDGTIPSLGDIEIVDLEIDEKKLIVDGCYPD